MPLNIPSGTKNNISFGPGRMFLGAYGTGYSATGITPTTDVGFISEDGISLEITSEKKDIVQGNPKLVEYSFTQAHGVMATVTSIEWNMTKMAWALGGQAGTTSGTAPAGGDVFKFGGDPINIELACRIEHQMAITGDTMNIDIWRCMGESGFSIALGADEHSFEFKFKAMRATKSWTGTDLPSYAQLIQFKRVQYP